MAAVGLWSTSIAVARSLAEQLGPLTAAAAVYLTGAVLMAAESWLCRHRLPGLSGYGRAYLWGCGGLFVFYMYAFYEALALAADRLQVLELGMLNYLWPTLTVLLSVVLLGRKANWGLLPGTLLALVGILVVMTHEGIPSWNATQASVAANPVAYALALAAGVSWALYSTLTSRLSAQAGEGSVFPFVLATGVLMLLLRAAGSESSTWTLTAAGEVAFLGAATAVAYACWDLAMRRGDVTQVACFSYLTPLLSTLVSCAYLRVAPGRPLWLGCAAVVAGSLLSWRSLAPAQTDPERRRARAAAEAGVQPPDGSASLRADAGADQAAR
jgi:drug/metabolite transporter (DMT)-like permease